MINLKKIFNKYPGCLASSAKLKDALLREYPTEKCNVNILAIIYDLGIASKIRTSAVIDNRDIKKMCSLVEDEYGIEHDYVDRNIKTWADAFSVSIVDRKDDLRITKNEINQASDNLVSENIKDYVVEPLKSGDYMITKYTGVGHKKIRIPREYNGKPITRIGVKAFSKCREIEEVTISRGVTIIGCAAFSDCTSLKTVSLPEGLQMIGDSSKYSGDGVFENTAISQIKLPCSLNFITNRTFANCKQLKSIDIPNRITELPDYCFYECDSLEQVTLPKYLEEIPSFCFFGCNSLKSIYLPSDIKSINSLAFGRTSLEKVVIPKKCTFIGFHAFSFYNYHITPIFLIPESVERIVEGAFDSNSVLYCYPGSFALSYARKYGYTIRNAHDFIS